MKIKQITVNLAMPDVTRVKFQGRDFLKAPVVMITEGERNEDFYPSVTLQNSVDQWAMMPVYFDHPQIDGLYVSGRNAQIADVAAVGWVVNPTFNAGTKALTADVLIDIERAEALGHGAVLARIESLDGFDVSIGSFVEYAPDFKTISAIYPDHLALLPNNEGACSWAEGCGIPRINQLTKPKDIKPMPDEKTDCQCDALLDQVASLESEVKTLSAKQVDPEDMAAVKWARETHDLRVNEIITNLEADESCQFTKAELQVFSLNQLEVLNRSLAAAKPAQQLAGDYSGAAGAQPQQPKNNERKGPPMPPPVMLRKVGGNQ